MNGKLKAVVIGAAHVHIIEVCKYIRECPDVELAAVADAAPIHESDLAGTKPYSRRWNLEFVRKNGLKLYDDYRTMLDEVKPDLALIETEIELHTEIFRECAARRIAVSFEKPMCSNYEQALEIERIARLNNVEVFVNWPIAWRQWLYQMKDVLDSGRMGPLIKIRYLAGHTGPVGPSAMHRGTDEKKAEAMTSAEKAGMWWYQKDCGGGAFLDMCCYGSMMSVWLNTEECQAAAAMKGNFVHTWSDIDDNGVMILRYPHSMSVVEATWTTPASAVPAGPEIFCRGGVIACERQENGIVLTKITDVYGKSEYLEQPKPDIGLRNIACAFAEYRLRGREMPPITRFENNMKAMAIVDAGLRSAESGKTELVCNTVWGN